MSIANTALLFMIGVLGALALGVAVWAVFQYRRDGFKAPAIIGALAVTALTCTVLGLYLSGLSYGY